MIDMSNHKLFSKPVVLCVVMLVFLFYSDDYVIIFSSYIFESFYMSLRFIVDFIELAVVLAILFFYNKTNTPVLIGTIKIKTVTELTFIIVPVVFVLFLIEKLTGIEFEAGRYYSDINETMSVSKVLFYFSVFVIQPIIQGVVFCGVLFNELIKYSRKILFSVSTLFFIVYNAYDIRFGVCLSGVVLFVFLSIILLLARMKSGGVLLPVILHALFNIFYFNIQTYHYGYDG
ncbi:CPBP family intramembrane glutamic endopeptidase [Morganella morganii]|uniref:CPBP family intramembrane glutamic endopeptidase n=1 Tax=Morganella morganii TaxID=582 RepID=UPI00339C3834